MLRRRKRLELMDAKSGWLFVMMLRDVMDLVEVGDGGGLVWVKYSSVPKAVAPESHSQITLAACHARRRKIDLSRFGGFCGAEQQ